MKPYSLLLVLIFSPASYAQEVLNVRDWGTGFIVTYQFTLSGSTDTWRAEVESSGSSDLELAWMESGYTADISSFYQGSTFVISNEDQEQKLSLAAGDRIAFSILGRGTGFEESSYEVTLSLGADNPVSFSKADFLRLTSWYDPTWGGGYISSYECEIDPDADQIRVEFNYNGRGKPVLAWPDNWFGQTDYGSQTADAGYVLSTIGDGLDYLPKKAKFSVLVENAPFNKRDFNVECVSGNAETPPNACEAEFYLADIDSSNPSNLTRIGDQLYYFADSLEPEGTRQLFRLDPSSGESTRLTNIAGAPTRSFNSLGNSIAQIGDRLYFKAGTGDTTGIYSYDQITGTTRFETATGRRVTYYEIVALDGKLYFSSSSIAASISEATGVEPYSYDPTTGVTALVADVSPGFTPSSPRNFFSLNGKVYFSGARYSLRAFDPVSGAIEVIPSQLSVTAIAVLGNDIYLSSNSDGARYAFQRYNTETGVTTDILSSATPVGNPRDLSAIDGNIYYSAYTETSPDKAVLFQLTDQGSEQLTSDNISIAPGSLTELDGQLFFFANDGIESRLYRYDPITQGVFLVIENDEVSFPGERINVVKLNGSIYFRAILDDASSELISYTECQ